MITNEQLAKLEKNLGYIFTNKDLIKQALLHSSYINRSNNLKIYSNERLEFLGDRVLGLAIAHKLYETFNNNHEGILAHAIAYLNSRETLYKIAQSIHLPNFILIKGITKKQPLKSIYANALEAILGSIYLDSNFAKVKEVIIRLWQSYIDNSLNTDVKISFNPKSILQEWTQKNKLPLPLYELKDKRGTEHAPIFTIELTVMGYEKIRVQANNIRLAHKIAAYNFIINNKIIKENIPPTTCISEV